MADDALSLVLAGLEETPVVRPAFAESLRHALYRELGFEPLEDAAVSTMDIPIGEAPRTTAPARRSLGDRLRGLRGVLWPVTPRVALLAVVALLLLACSAAAAYLVTRSWLSSGPRGVQYTDDFTFTEVFRDTANFYMDLGLAPDGRTIIAIREPLEAHGKMDVTAQEIVRIDPGHPETAPATLFPLERLRDARYWDAGTDLSGGIEEAFGGVVGDRMSVASNGDIFLPAAIGIGTTAEGLMTGPDSSTVVVIHPDGTVQKIATFRELADAGLLPGLAQPGSGLFATPSSPDHLWVRAEGRSEPGQAAPSYALLEITDPNADGDWTDRVIRPLVLPSTVPAFDPATWSWAFGPFLAEPSAPGRDRSDSVLLQLASRAGEIRWYRIADPDHDGDATDPGEAELAWSGQAGDGVDVSMAAAAPRLVMDGDRVAVDEMVVSPLSREGRVSRITPAGVVDIVRALPWGTGNIVPAPDGSIYLSVQTSSPEQAYLINRLAPVPVGATSPPTSGTMDQGAGAPSHAAAPSPVESPAKSPMVERHPVTAAVPRMAFYLLWDANGEALLSGVDGSGPAELIDDAHIGEFCQSADARQVAFWSDTEVPGEYALYLAGADGSNRTKVSDTARSFACPFPPGMFAFIEGGGPTYRIVAHDLAGRPDRELAKDVRLLHVHDDGRTLVLASGSDARTLQVLDVTTGVLRTVASVDAAIRDARPSPDASRVAFMTGPPEAGDTGGSARWEVRVADLTSGSARSLLTTEGLQPQVAWSSDGRRITVRTRVGDSGDPAATGTLLVIDTDTGSSRKVADERAVFAGWSPDEPDTFAYATRSALYLVEGDAVRKLAEAPATRLCAECTDEPATGWPIGDWEGWSPDGAWIGLGDFSSAIAAVEVATGDVHVLFNGAGKDLPLDPRWWRLP